MRIDQPREAAIVSSIATLCRDLGLDLVAEGVETAEQERLLLTHGVRKAQGFLFARPAPPEVVERGLGVSLGA